MEETEVDGEAVVQLTIDAGPPREESRQFGVLKVLFEPATLLPLRSSLGLERVSQAGSALGS